MLTLYLFFYSLLLYLLLLCGLPLWLLLLAVKAKYRAGLGERLGLVPRRLQTSMHKKTIWVHAVSVGEMLAARRLMEEMEAALPQHRIVLSTTTASSQSLARKLFGAERVFYMPMDFGFAVRRYLRALRPELLVLMETEFWPNLLRCSHKAGVKVAVVNARISDRSLPGYRRMRFALRPLLQNVDAFLAQSEEDIRRLLAIGALPDSVLLAGNLKFDVRAAGETPLTRALRKHLAADAKLLVCGSTMVEEEELLLERWPHLLTDAPETVMLLAPRKPERFDEAARLLSRRGVFFLRRSEWMQRQRPIAAGTILLLDSIGELASVYSMAAVAFVGGSAVPNAGGHNPLEPAQFGVPVVIGASHENFRDIVDAMLTANAIRIVEQETLGSTLQSLLQDRVTATAMGARGRAVFAAQSGATARAVETLTTLLRNGDAL